MDDVCGKSTSVMQNWITIPIGTMLVDISMADECQQEWPSQSSQSGTMLVENGMAADVSNDLRSLLKWPGSKNEAELPGRLSCSCCRPQRSLFAIYASQNLFKNSVAESIWTWLLFLKRSLERKNIFDWSDAPLFVAILLVPFMLPDDDENSLSLLLAWSQWPNGSIIVNL